MTGKSGPDASRRGVKIGLYCACGAGIEGVVPRDAAPRLRDFWGELHAAPECRPVGREEAEDAYRKRTGDSLSPFADDV